MKSMQGEGSRGPLGILLTPWVKRVMIATGSLSIVSAIAIVWIGSSAPLHLALEPIAVWGRGELAPLPALWQLLTYPFVELHVFGLLLGILMYGWIGGALEAWWGSVRFFKFYFGITIWVGFLTVILALLWPNLATQRFMGPYPIISALLVAWGLSFPNREIRLFFVLPVKGIVMVWFSAGITLLYIVFSGQVAPFVPHILAMASSACLVTGAWRGQKPLLYWKKWRLQKQIDRERRARKKRVDDTAHLRIVDSPEDSDGEELKNGDENRRNNGAGKNGSGGGWIH